MARFKTITIDGQTHRLESYKARRFYVETTVVTEDGKMYRHERSISRYVRRASDIKRAEVQEIVQDSVDRMREVHPGAEFFDFELVERKTLATRPYDDTWGARDDS